MEPKIQNPGQTQQRPDPYSMMGKNTASTPGWSWRLFSFSLFLLIASAVVYLGIEFGYRPFLNSQIDKVDTSLAQIEEEVSSGQQESFINFYSQVLHIEEILENHEFFSPFFQLLEQNIQSNVVLTALDYDAVEKRIAIEGLAASFKDLGEQLSRIDELDEIERSLVSESRAADGGGVYFRLVLYPDPTIFEAENTELNTELSEQPEEEPVVEEDVQIEPQIDA